MGKIYLDLGYITQSLQIHSRALDTSDSDKPNLEVNLRSKLFHVYYSCNIASNSKDYYSNNIYYAVQSVHLELAKMESECVALLQLSTSVMGSLGTVPGYHSYLALFYFLAQ